MKTFYTTPESEKHQGKIGHQSNNNEQETQLTQREKIPGTPFTLIYQEQHGWFIVMGDHRLTEPTPTKQEQIEKLETNKWELITTVVISVVERLRQYEELHTKKPYETNSI